MYDTCIHQSHGHNKVVILPKQYFFDKNFIILKSYIVSF